MSRKQRRMLIRIIAAAVLLLIAALIPLDHWLKIGLFLIPYFIVGYDVVWGAISNILRGQVFDEKFLMALATGGAFATGEYLEAVAVMLFYQVGELFQSIAVGKSRRSIAQLMDIRPDRAVVLRDGTEMEAAPDDVAVGETIVVYPGEKISLDGVILQGETTVDTAALTGESLPRGCKVGDEVLSGSVNLTGLIHIRVERSFEQSTVSKILELVENSALKKARAERFITRFAKYYTPCVVIAAAALALIPPLFLGGWQDWIHRALIFLVVSCPCALVISVPLSFFGGIGGASRKGILIKGGSDLEALAKVQTVVFDKTGTLTTGNFRVAEIASEGCSNQEILELVALAESHSNHPIAQSICAKYAGELDRSRVSDLKEMVGQGICATVDGRLIYAGNEVLMKSAGVAEPLPKLKGTAIYVAIDGRYTGFIRISDELKPDAKEAVLQLRKQKIAKLVMLSGDAESKATLIAEQLKLDRAEAELLPQQKVEIFEQILEENQAGTVAFVGDGINDAPVLARADVGIAMGAMGSDAAIEAADVVLMDDQLKKLPLAVDIAKRTMRIVWQNIIFSLVVKGLVLLLGALGIAGIWLAVFADVGVMVIAILNAMRALK
ncbi:MAG: cadmium-translocating P-type ATPase [Clostridia bacterium]|nr:cadmium-translocating P-type ATPase [Clostridia bacterium]